MKKEKSEVFSNCRKLYKDIILGYTYVPAWKFYIKHFKETDIGEINEIKERIVEDCKEKGLLSEKESVKILIEHEAWSEEKEREIEILSEEITNQLQVKTKLFIKSQVDSVQKVIDEKSQKLEKIIRDKDSVTGLTLEKFSEKKSSENIVRLALFKDNKLEKPLYTEEEYDEIEPEELDQLVEVYSLKLGELDMERLKMISAASFFMNLLMLCKNNPFTFFGKPACELTNFQTEMFSNGISYKSVLEKNNTPPMEFHSDLEKMVQWYESAGHVERMSEKSKDKDGSTMMGASKKELTIMAGKDGQIIDLAKEAEKKGGNLDMKDFIRIHSKD